jgi:phosphohistidine phosphatase
MRDFDRPLRDRGHRNARAIAEAMRRAGIEPDLVICSKARRALETWDEVADVLGPGRYQVEFTDSLYGTDATGYLRLVVEAPPAECLLLVGHNPMMEDLAFALSGNGDAEAIATLEKGFPTAGLAVIAFEGALSDARPGKGRLELFLTPATL